MPLNPDRQLCFLIFRKTQKGEIHPSPMSTSLCSAVTYSQASESTEGRERDDISCIISCSAKRCLSDLVHDMPPCFSVSSSLVLIYIYDSVSPPFLLNHLIQDPEPAAGSRGGGLSAEERIFCPAFLISHEKYI